jgi:hypothetical protein
MGSLLHYALSPSCSEVSSISDTAACRCGEDDAEFQRSGAKVVKS